jgi:hypothetical protein
MWIGVLTDDENAFQSALERGADPNVLAVDLLLPT